MRMKWGQGKIWDTWGRCFPENNWSCALRSNFPGGLAAIVKHLHEMSRNLLMSSADRTVDYFIKLFIWWSNFLPVLWMCCKNNTMHPGLPHNFKPGFLAVFLLHKVLHAFKQDSVHRASVLYSFTGPFLLERQFESIFKAQKISFYSYEFWE